MTSPSMTAPGRSGDCLAIRPSRSASAEGAVAGSIADVITYLKMTEKPARPPRPVPLAKLAFLRAERCTVSFYRYLYNTVGEPWIWYLRRLWSDEELSDHLSRTEIEVFVLYAA